MDFDNPKVCGDTSITDGLVLKESHLLCVEPNILKEPKRPLNGVVVLDRHHFCSVSYGMGNAMFILYQGFGVSLRDVLLGKNCGSFLQPRPPLIWTK